MNQASWIDVLHSRKFWALVLALLAIVAGFATHQLDAWQAIQAAVAALAAYSTGVAIEDAGYKAGQGKTTPAPTALPPAAPPAGEAKDQVKQSTSGITGPPSHMIPPQDLPGELQYIPAGEEAGPSRVSHLTRDDDEYRIPEGPGVFPGGES